MLRYRQNLALGFALTLFNCLSAVGHAQNKVDWVDRFTANSGGPILVTSNLLTAQSPFDTKRKECHAVVYTGVLLNDRKYEFRLSSDKIDTYLRLEAPNGVEVAQDDDSGGGTNSRLLFEPQFSGMYRLIVTTYAPKTTGKYQLVITSTSNNPGNGDPNARNLLLKAEGRIGVSGKEEQGRPCEVFYVGIGSTSATKIIVDGTKGVPLKVVVKNSKGQTVMELKNVKKAAIVEGVVGFELITGRYETLQIYIMPVVYPSPQNDFRPYRYTFRLYRLPTA